ncbi:unnamed protein product [Blepharisma stoltei]|uniref:Nuclear migration protein nudC n=1 Tax=Blepharisma stoltei TaxID=1481888 RepID=A0AAU9IWR6_9CILI|nr:unnamed protein product [Blepharisma stoltei]
MEEEKFDGLLMTVVQQSQGINGFFDAFFGFLRRKTDFYAQPESGKQLLDKSFNSQLEAYKEQQRIKEAKQKAAEEKKKREQELKNQKVVEITDEEAERIAKEESARKAAQAAPSQQVQKQAETVEAEPKKEGEEEEEEKGQVPVGNGGTTDRYIWTQTLGELTANFFIPADANGKNIKVDIGVQKLKVTYKGQTYIEGEFYSKVKPDEHLWTIDTIDNRKVLILTIDKFEGMTWWKTVLKGDTEINTKKVEPENSKLSDLDEETRPTVEKMMIDQQRKAMGLPTLEEEGKQDMLKKFMAAHPEMDFSKCKFN